MASLDGPLDIRTGQNQNKDRHHDGASAAEAELQVLDTEVVKILSDRSSAVGRAAAGQQVDFLKDTESIEVPYLFLTKM